MINNLLLTPNQRQMTRETIIITTCKLLNARVTNKMGLYKSKNVPSIRINEYIFSFFMTNVSYTVGMNDINRYLRIDEKNTKRAHFYDFN